MRPAWRAAYAWGVRATAGAKTPYDVALMLDLLVAPVFCAVVVTVSPSSPSAALSAAFGEE